MTLMVIRVPWPVTPGDATLQEDRTTMISSAGYTVRSALCVPVRTACGNGNRSGKCWKPPCRYTDHASIATGIGGVEPVLSAAARRNTGLLDAMSCRPGFRHWLTRQAANPG